MIRYSLPQNWIRYDPIAIVKQLTEAKAAVLSLTTIPFQRRWADTMQTVQLKREVAGTSKIEGADFTDAELEKAIVARTPDELITRSQRQAHAAVRAYQFIAKRPNDQPIDDELIR